VRIHPFLQGELAGAEAWPYCFSNKVGNDGTREQNCAFHRWRQYLCGDQTLGFDIDYKRLLKEFQGRGILIRAFYYTAIIEDQEFSSIRPLIDRLDYNGFTVVTKASKEFIDADGRRQGEGQHGHRAYGGCDGTRRARRRDRAIFW